MHFAVTSHPTAQWTAQQLLQAFPWNTAPRFLLRDRDCNFGQVFRETAAGLGMEEVLCAPRSPWQNAYAERLIGSIRRECLDHVIIFNEAGLRRVLGSYFHYCATSRTHLSLRKDAPIPRAVKPPEFGRGAELAGVGGLRYRYERCAA
jgi:putative transposase